MTTLYKRANARQCRILRAIEGAVRDASNKHPAQKVDARMARSIAKRAAGTVTAMWPELLATPLASSDTSAGRLAGSGGARSETLRSERGAGQSTSYLTGPLRRAHLQIGRMVADAKRAGDAARVLALQDALRVIGGELGK